MKNKLVLILHGCVFLLLCLRFLFFSRFNDQRKEVVICGWMVGSYAPTTSPTMHGSPCLLRSFVSSRMKKAQSSKQNTFVGVVFVCVNKHQHNNLVFCSCLCGTYDFLLCSLRGFGGTNTPQPTTMPHCFLVELQVTLFAMPVWYVTEFVAGLLLLGSILEALPG